jgi:hypothetical protein
MKRQTIIAAIVFLGGLTLFFVIVGSSSPNNAPLVTAKTGGGMNGGLDYTVSANRGLGGTPTNNGSFSGIISTANLTDNLIQNYAQNILQMNNGFTEVTPNSTNTISFPSVDSLSNQIAESINQSLPSKTYTVRDIIVGADNSTSSQLTYIKAIEEINQKNFKNLQIPINEILGDFFTDQNQTKLSLYVRAAESQVSDLLAIPVPQQLAVWHLENINLWAKKISAYGAILNTDNDPVMATAALRGVPEILNENLTLDSLIQKRWAALISS